jgi:hypothetical protein
VTWLAAIISWFLTWFLETMQPIGPVAGPSLDH